MGLLNVIQKGTCSAVPCGSGLEKVRKAARNFWHHRMEWAGGGGGEGDAEGDAGCMVKMQWDGGGFEEA